jgi:hypothetical protein
MRVPPLCLPLALSVALAGCGGTGGGPPEATRLSDPPGPAAAARAELAARAAAAQDLAGVRLYTLASPGRPDRTIMVVRARDGGWRVDVPGGALGGEVDVSIIGTPGGMFHCALAASPEQTECAQVKALDPAADPRVQHVFTDWLDVLRDRSAAVAVAAAPSPPGARGRCFAVQPSAASLLAPLDAGVYCFDPDGTLTAAQLELGELRLASDGGPVPPSVELPGPVVDRRPLPTAPPPPSATPVPTGTPAG